MLPFLLVLLALIPCTWITLHYSDLPQFGKHQDDGLYVIAGKSLQESQGYRIANLPGKPFQTKYQPLFPALLAVLWSVNGHFPENLKLFSVLAWAIFVAYLLLAFAVFRAYGFPPWHSSWMVMLLALNPWLLYWALLPISDLAVSVLILAAFWVLHCRREDWRWWMVAGIAVAAASLTKVMAILLVPAIWMGGWPRREWKRCLVVTLPGMATFAAWTLWASSHKPALDHPILWYYTDYVAGHVRNGGLQALPQILQSNIGNLIGVAGNSVVYNLAESMPGRFLSVVILAAALSGAVRFVRRTGRAEYPVFCALLVLVLLVCHFSPNARLLSPVLPMFVMGLFAEAGHVRLLMQRSRESRKKSDRIAAHVFTGAVAAGCIYALVLNVTFLARGIPQILDQDRVAFAREWNTFAWCKRELSPASVVLANNDTALYLATGLSSLRAVPSSVAFYKGDTAAELENFTHFDQLADVFGVTHIVLLPGDFADFDEQQRQWIVRTLLANPRHKRIYSTRDSTVLEIDRSYTPLVGATRWNQAPGQ